MHVLGVIYIFAYRRRTWIMGSHRDLTVGREKEDGRIMVCEHGFNKFVYYTVFVCV